MSERFGREIRVFETFSLSPTQNDAANKGNKLIARLLRRSLCPQIVVVHLEFQVLMFLYLIFLMYSD